ncbi:MAG: two-component sensor histidine kinase [Proteobacteria bacterium]|nr:two-component sensor histidine kinase [Pseudomonadota bacterium]
MNDIKKNYASVQKNILVSMILVPLIPFFSSLAIGYFYFASSLEKNTVSAMKRIVSDHGNMISSFLEERKGDLAFIARSYTFEDLSQKDVLEHVFQTLQNKSHAFVDLGVFDENGVHVSYQGPFKLTGMDYHDTSWFREVLQNRYYISDVFMGFRHVPHFIIAVSENSPTGKWVLRATIDSAFFNEFVKSVRTGKTGEAYLINKNGFYQTEKRSGGMLMEKDPDFAHYSNAHPEVRTFIDKDTSGATQVYATMWLKDNTWQLIVKQEKNDAFHLLRRALSLIVVVMTLGGTGLVVLAFVITGRVVRRIEKTDAEKGRLSEQLIRAGRYAEIGEMATGFAHEINNPLQIMKSEQALMSLLIDDIASKDPQITPAEQENTLLEINDSLAQISIQIERCARITGSILKFGRQEETQAKAVDVRDFMDEVTRMVEKKAGVHGITIEKHLPDSPLLIHADPAQMQQVFLNLLNNAFDAVTQAHGARGGTIIIRTEQIPDKGRVEISVEDNGTGVSPEFLDKIFSPFFTTKPVGKGTGLGLSVCFGIISAMGGSVRVKNMETSGARFTVDLPAMVTDGESVIIS